MASTGLNLIVVTPSAQLAEAQAQAVTVPTFNGDVQILPGHVGLVCELGTGILHYGDGQKEEFMTVSGGVVEVNGDTVRILADRAELPGHVDEGRAREALKRAEERLKGLEKGTVDYDRALRSARRAQARLEILERMKK